MILTVAKITELLKNEIHDTKPDGSSSYFNVVPDADGNYIISLQMAQYLEPEQFTPILYNPIVN